MQIVSPNGTISNLTGEARVFQGSNTNRLSQDLTSRRFWGENTDDGDDVLFGGNGTQKLKGGRGDDKLFGGSGRDTFHFDKGKDKDVIRDFQNNADRIELDGFASNFNYRSVATQVGDDVVLDFGSGDRLTIENATIGELANDLYIV